MPIEEIQEIQKYPIPRKGSQLSSFQEISTLEDLYGNEEHMGHPVPEGNNHDISFISMPYNAKKAEGRIVTSRFHLFYNCTDTNALLKMTVN